MFGSVGYAVMLTRTTDSLGEEVRSYSFLSRCFLYSWCYPSPRQHWKDSLNVNEVMRSSDVVLLADCCEVAL